MATKLFFHNAFSNRQVFYLQNGSRPWHAMIIIYEGSFSFEIDQKSFVINKNEVAYFPKDIVFSRQIIKPIAFHQFGFHSDADELYLPASDCGRLNLPEEYVASTVSLLCTLDIASVQKRNRIYQNVIDNILMANHTFSAGNTTKKAVVDKDAEFVAEYMYDHLNEKINISELAGQLHLTHTGLIGKFKRVYGCTPNEFLIEIRMKLARKLISENELRINEIAALCGYSNAYYFSNAFHAYFGMTPSNYRASQQNG